jgi:hypothetical protein
LKAGLTQTTSVYKLALKYVFSASKTKNKDIKKLKILMLYECGTIKDFQQLK